MLRITRSPAFQRQLLTCAISTSRTLLMALQTAKPSLTSLNAAAVAHLDLKETLEEAASSHFSESSAFPEFSPMEDALLSEAVLRIKPKLATMTSRNFAATSAQFDLNGTLEEVASSHFSESSAFPEFSPMEDTLLSTVVPLTPDKILMMDSHAMAQEELNEVMQKHFCASSDFPEYSAVEEECMMHEKE